MAFSTHKAITKPALTAALEAARADRDGPIKANADELAGYLDEFDTLPELIEDLVSAGEEAVFAMACLIDRVLGKAKRTDTSKKKLVVPDQGFTLVTGDLAVAGQVQNGGVLMVLGDVAIDGLYWDRDVGCLLIALGNVTTRRVNIYGGAYIQGNWRATECFYGVDHSWSIYVGKTLASPLVLLEDKTVHAHKIAAKLQFGTRAESDAKARSLLVPDVWTDGELDLEKLADRICKDKRVFK